MNARHRQQRAHRAGRAATPESARSHARRRRENAPHPTLRASGAAALVALVALAATAPGSADESPTAHSMWNERECTPSAAPARCIELAAIEGEDRGRYLRIQALRIPAERAPGHWAWLGCMSRGLGEAWAALLGVETPGDAARAPRPGRARITAHRRGESTPRSTLATLEPQPRTPGTRWSVHLDEHLYRTLRASPRFEIHLPNADPPALAFETNPNARRVLDRLPCPG